MSASIPGESGLLAAEGIREITRGLAKDVPITDYATGLSPHHWSTLADGAWDLLGVPEEAGGASLNLRDLVEVAQAWGERILPLPLMPTIVAKRWSAAARVSGGPVTYSLAEDGGTLASFAAFPDIRLLTATDAEPGATAGDGREPDKALAEVAAAGTVVEDFAPTLGKGTVPAATEFGPAARHELAVLIAAEAVGTARALLTGATAYAKTREQFGRPIGSFQAVKHHLANAYIAVELAVTAVSWAAQEPGAYAVPVNTALQEAQRAAELSTQVYGGMGFTWEMGIHFFLRHLLSLRTSADALLADSSVNR
jgi:alkylation response protein AidB-like acyl-CoA dehydrogenase